MEVCLVNSTATLYVSGIFPSEGHSVSGTTVRVFERHFERSTIEQAICLQHCSINSIFGTSKFKMLLWLGSLVFC